MHSGTQQWYAAIFVCVISKISKMSYPEKGLYQRCKHGAFRLGTAHARDEFLKVRRLIGACLI